jgi:serine/threonine protein kinase
MSLAAGTRLGPYEILAPIGAGGMGEVYRATDTKLGRDVAIKILPEAFARDADRMARFEREAKVLASLNHPHIAAIYGLEESDGMRALVMELVEGPTLAERIDARAMALDDTLPIAKQIAEALEYAHEKGIIHRDLKPANVKLTADGHVKVLDFGLAKALEAQAPAVGNPSVSPTLTIEGTLAGVILGTAAYMAPEQARGTMLDKRADIWSFGVVLYEMLTGKQPFAGATVSDTLAAVLKTEPDLTLVPVQVRKLLRRCLDKDRKRRLRDIGDVWELLDEEPQDEGPRRSRPWTFGIGGWILAGGLFLALGILSFIHFREAPPLKTVLRYTISAPENTSNLHSFAISPDGRYLAMATEVNGKRQLWLRALDALQAHPMPGTDDATYPFWSPDSHYIGFFVPGKMKKIAASGGPAQSLCDAPSGQGGSWNRSGVIVFSPSTTIGSAIQSVTSTGGVPVSVIRAKGYSSFPVFLPDGRHFLYVAGGEFAEQNGVFLSSLDGKENRRVSADISGTFGSGWLLFIRENTLMAQPFDPANEQLKSEAFQVAEGVSLTNFYYTPASVSETGVLVYANSGMVGGSQIVWYDRVGKLLGVVRAPGMVLDPAISPDQKSIAYRRAYASRGDLWLWDLKRETEQRFTTEGFVNVGPFWSPRGDRIVFASNRGGGVLNLYQKTASGTGQDDLLLTNGNNKRPFQWSQDSRFVVYGELDPKTRNDIWVLPMEGGPKRKPVVFLNSKFNETFSQLSPDSHWMAYTSDSSGRPEVYVRPFPSGEGQWKISIAGGEQPRWRGDGRELFFVSGDGKMMVVPVKAMPGAKSVFEAGTPTALFEGHLYKNANVPLFEYDVTPDGKRFLIATTGGVSASAPLLTVVVNWDAGLKK